ncbi:NAD(P)-binding domain-containing protein, partial [Haemophilus parainfluenzae]|uniref:NAD(P)-binding domain-containing protein n=1 Tax=Haemophilus parainfluenzae TaxID=729 RepID=UPI00157F6676
METIGIVGLGLIGGSLGLDFVAAGYRVLGVARRPETCQLAQQRKVVHEASCQVDLLKEADLIFIC